MTCEDETRLPSHNLSVENVDSIPRKYLPDSKARNRHVDLIDLKLSDQNTRISFHINVPRLHRTGRRLPRLTWGVEILTPPLN